MLKLVDNNGRFVAHFLAGLFKLGIGLAISHIHATEVWNASRLVPLFDRKIEQDVAPDVPYKGIVNSCDESNPAEKCGFRDPNVISYLGNYVHPRKNKLKLLTGAAALFCIVLGIVFEGVGGYLYMDGFFRQIKHQALYSFFVPWAIAYMLESGYVPGFEEANSNYPLYSTASALMTFTCTTITLNGHAESKHSPAEIASHEIMALNSKFSLLSVFILFLGIVGSNKGITRGFYVLIPGVVVLTAIWLMSFSFFVYYVQVDFSYEEMYSLYLFELIVVMSFHAINMRKYYLREQSN